MRKESVKEWIYAHGKLNCFAIYMKLGFLWDTRVKNSLASAEDLRDAVQSLSQEDPLEKEMATHSKFSCWGGAGLPSTESQKLKWLSFNWSDLAHEPIMLCYKSIINQLYLL